MLYEVSLGRHLTFLCHYAFIRAGLCSGTKGLEARLSVLGAFSNDKVEDELLTNYELCDRSNGLIVARLRATLATSAATWGNRYHHGCHRTTP